MRQELQLQEYTVELYGNPSSNDKCTEQVLADRDLSLSENPESLHLAEGRMLTVGRFTL